MDEKVTQISEKDQLNRFLTHSSQSSNWGLNAARILNAALSAVDPYSAVMKGLQNSKFLPELEKGGDWFSSYRTIHLIGVGKAAQPMTEAAQDYFQEKISSGIILVKDGYTKNVVLSDKIKVFEASHPIPDQRGINATQEIVKLLHKSNADDLVICLFSGGGSALMNNPVPGISLADLQQLTELLLVSGANINEINTLRKHLDQVKGGQIARLAAPAQVLCLILSDVVGDPLDVIASGPTVPDPTTYLDAINILKRCAIYELVPTTVRSHLEAGQQGKIAETPKPGEEIFNNVQNIVVGSNQTATQAALVQAKIEGFKSLCLTNYLQGEASQVGLYLGSILRQLALHDQPIPRPACIIAGGETTVTIKGDGKGGRNQELALGSVAELDGLENIALITLASDGGDGLSDAAGAVVTGETYSRALSLNLNPRDFLLNNDSYNFFLPLGDLLIIGPTRTNVNDLTFLFAF